MAATDNLGITLVEQAQAQKEVVINEGFATLDAAVAGLLEIATTGGTTTVTALEALTKMVSISGTLAADAEIVLPAVRREYVFRNATAGAFLLTVKVTGSAADPVEVPQGESRMILSDGTDAFTIDAAVPASVETRLDALEASDITLAAADAALDTRLDAVEATAITLDTRLDAVEAADTALDTRVDALEAADTALDTRLDALEVPQPYDLGCFYPGVPGNSALLLRMPVVRAVTFADDFAGSQAKASVAATGSTVFTVKVNGSSVGTITFAVAGTSGTFVTTGGSLSLAAGDVLSVEGPATADTTLADIGIVFKGTR